MIRRFRAIPGKGIVASSSAGSGYASWMAAYQEFEKIIDQYFPDEDKIAAEVSKFYRAHRDDPQVREAYRRWESDVDV